MSKSYLKQLLTYINKVYDIGGKINTLEDKRVKSPDFADIIVADALYCKSNWIKEILSIGMDAVIRVKDEKLHIVKDALALFKCQEANKEWIIKKEVKNIQ